MTTYDFDTRSALLESGKQQFLEHGFEGASLRTICANAGVTTGSFYSHFKQKKDLFAAIIEDDLAASGTTFDELADRAVGHISQDDDEAVAMDFIMDHRDLFKLLFDCSAGTPYEDFKTLLLSKIEASYQAFFDANVSETIDADLVRTIVRMKFTQYCEMVYENYDREKARYLTDRIGVFTAAGLKALLDA